MPSQTDIQYPKAKTRIRVFYYLAAPFPSLLGQVKHLSKLLRVRALLPTDMDVDKAVASPTSGEEAKAAGNGDQPESTCTSKSIFQTKIFLHKLQ